MRLDVSAIVAGYGKVPILNGVGLAVEPGQVVGVIGPNGAGKSTLLKVIFGYLRPTQGSVSLDGNEIAGRRPDEILRLGVGFVPQAGGVFARMTVQENLALGGYALGRTAVRDTLERLYERFPLLFERRSQPAGTLSGGERRLLEIARVMMVKPRLVLLDEPSASLSPAATDEVYAKIGDVNRTEGTSFLIVEQNVDLILDNAHYIYALQLGANAVAGAPATFREDAGMRAIFLGGVVDPPAAGSHNEASDGLPR
jgi:ABC-type branched-subunit amino acid transport system ATPase component